jgi:outer membrane protein assembly factor BamB/tetratricopeptide (TPR) repeat protein
MNHRGVIRTLLVVLLAAGTAPAQSNVAAAVNGLVPDPYEDLYRAYNPGFVDKLDEESMKLSSETNFYTLTLLPESERAYALVAAAKEKEQTQRYGEATEIYQKIIDEYPDMLYRVSEQGVFVPLTQYCQLRILAFPPEALQQYRIKHDARARESYDMAARKNSLEGLADVRDRMLATSFGAPSLITLGYSALDQGHYLEALEYFDLVWKHYPEVRAQNPHIPLSVALCRKMLGMGANAGERFGLIGQWKLDEGSGAKVVDGSGLGHDGTAGAPVNWVQGKFGGALRFDTTNGVFIPSKTTLDIGTGGSDFSVSLWLWLDAERPNDFFVKRGLSASDMLGLSVSGRGGQVIWTLATGSPRWESGNSTASVPQKRWTHIGFVKEADEVRLFVNGKLDLREKLKARVLKNAGSVTLGPSLAGMLDEVRLYNRALANREMAELAGAVGAATLQAGTTAGEAPLAVEFSAPGASGECRWEFGDGETAMGPKVRHVYGRGGDFTALLTVTAPDGQVSVARKEIRAKWKPADAAFATRMDKVLAGSLYTKPVSGAQLASAPNVASDDYLQMPPTTDPLAIRTPTWSADLSGARLDCHVYMQPVVTKQSVIFRHKNIIYCYSLLSGELRWKNDLGGRVTWQNWDERQYPQEDILVQDGIVFTPMSKVGPTLVALDEVTGQIKWAYGPMVATTADEANLRFETAPAGGPRTVFAGYVQDNIEGQTHTDTEYGMMAFESTTGRLLWRREICRLRPGKFSAGFAVHRRNRVRSFLSPPLYQEGTVYYCTDAGAVAALDALSGRVKWVMKYPYWLRPENVHDATRPFGRGGDASDNFRVYPHDPMFWFNQRPLLVGDALYVLPVDSPYLYRIDRRTGKVVWSREKGWRSPHYNAHIASGATYFLGPMSSGDLVLVQTGREKSIVTIDPSTGRTLWEAGDLIEKQTQPVLKYRLQGQSYTDLYAFNANGWGFSVAARPFLTSDDKVIVGQYVYHGCPIYGGGANLTVVDLAARTNLQYRYCLQGELPRYMEWSISKGTPAYRKALEDIPHKTDDVKRQIEQLKEVEKDSVPVNKYPLFLPSSRITFERFGVPFELRWDARHIEMVYDRDAVKKAVQARTDPDGLFARGEIAVAEGRLTEASTLIKQCLHALPPEDADARTMVNQQLYPVYKELARAGVRAGKADVELANCVGMSQTVGTLADEMETLLVLSEAYERKGDWKNAAQLAKSLVSRFGQYEYTVSSLLQGDVKEAEAACASLLGQAASQSKNLLYNKEINGAVGLMQKGVGAYFRSALSPLRKDLKVRAGELAALRLIRLQERFPALKQALDQEAATELVKQSADEQVARLWEYAGTPAAQKLADQLVAATEKELQQPGLSLENIAALRKRQWGLADAARIGGFKLPDAAQARLLAPRSVPPPAAVNGSALRDRTADLDEERGPAWLVLERGDPQQAEPDRLFLGGRVKKKFDNKFLLYCLDQKSNKVLWKAQEQRGETWFDEIRLFGKGDEPGFCEAFVHQDAVVVHGLYDVLAFKLTDGKLKWRYQVPFNFEIRHAVMSGDLLALAGESETLALYLGTSDPRGEVVWQEKEEGNLYYPPYFVGDRLVSLRKMPFNLTARYRSTGKMIGRLELPDLLLGEENPLLETGTKCLPVARDGSRLVVSDGWYHILLDVEKMKVLWKRLIDANDPTRLPPLRFELNGDYLAVVKQDFDTKAICMLDSRSGGLLWRTDPKVAGSPQPIDAMLIRDGRLYGIKPHPGQGFYFTAMDCKTGKVLFTNEQTGYGGKPEVRVRNTLYGDNIVALIKDRQDFEVKAFSAKDGKLAHRLVSKSAGDFGEHGRASATVQNGKLTLLGKSELVTTE